MYRHNALIYHYDKQVATQVALLLSGLKIDVTHVDSEPVLLDISSQNSPDLIFVSSSIETVPLIKKLQKNCPTAKVVILASYDHDEIVKQSIDAGAYDYLQTPFDNSHLLQLMERIVKHSKNNDSVIAHATNTKELFNIASFAAQADVSVLINGESGTGKEVLAQYIHNQSNRSSGRFVAINCAAIPETMIESILFGHSKGAFTGAIAASEGKLELANDGTLFLDEIGELPISLQAKLLRVLQEREVERLGCNKKIKLNIRVIAATNQNLEQLVLNGQFRADLFYRLNVFPLTCEPLRNRRDDILPLANFLLKRHRPDIEYKFTQKAERNLVAYDWPGNVRELDNIIQRALVLSRGLLIDEEKLLIPRVITKLKTKEVLDTKQVLEIKEVNSSSNITRLKQAIEKPNLQSSRKKAEFETIIETLKKFNGHRNKTAEELGLSSRALRYKIQEMKSQGIDIDDLKANSSVSNHANYSLTM